MRSVPRREWLLGLGLGLASGACGGRPPVAVPVPAPPPPPDVEVDALTDLLTVAGLDWLVLLEPARLWSIPWLAQDLRRILRDRRLDALAQTTGIDLRRVPELALAHYAPDSVAYVVRHAHDPLFIERRFRERLTGHETRTIHSHQRTSVFGRIGQGKRGLATIGRDVALFQYDGSRKKGPARIAVLYSEGKLEKIPRALSEPSLAAVADALGPAPAHAFWPGPFDGEAARGVRGLLGASTGAGIRLSPLGPGELELMAIIAGDYAVDAERAVELLRLAWHDLAQADLGSLLGLAAPLAPPEVSSIPVGLSLRVRLSASRLLRGLSAATVDNVQDIMKDPAPSTPTGPSDDPGDPGGQGEHQE